MRRAAYLMLFALLLSLCVLPALAAGQGEAQDLTALCRLFGNGTTRRHDRLTDDRRDTVYIMRKKGGYLEITSPEEIGGIYLELSERTLPFDVEIWDETQKAYLAAGSYQGHLQEYIPVPRSCRKLRILSPDNQRFSLNIAEIRVLGCGEVPDWVHVWQDAEAADLLLLVAHPDDEVLWFGGLLPTYAGEMGKTVQVACLVPATPIRRLEFLDSLWTCGVRCYPAFLDFTDYRGRDLEDQLRHWGEDTLMERVTACIRKYRPAVVISHGLSGEYGHPAHRAAAQVALAGSLASGDAGRFPASAEAFGTHTVQKVYLHEGTEHPVLMDWHVPLAAFGGQDGISVARDAMACHESQVRRGWQVEDSGEHDNRLFGLVYALASVPQDALDLPDFMAGVE
ncbi:MAG: PIG-L family deacetylase [Clostridia bacterium]|nr:PIG-L family deacetylase [Clostridia bacterium]